MFLDNLRRRLLDLEDSVSHQEHLLQHLKEQRAAVQLQLDRFVYPILTLPLEITSEIFLWCSPRDFAADPSEAPMLLLQVCRAWRAIALSVPVLWDSIDDEFTTPAKMEDVVTSWFSRAGARLFLKLSYISDPESAPMHSLIHRHASRLQSLKLYTHSQCLCDLADIRPFPLLRDLYLCSYNFDMPESTGTPIPVFSGAPLLRHLSLECISPSALLMPWSPLTKFSAFELSLLDCLDVLRLATSLSKFHRHGVLEAEETGTGQPLHHSGITSLTVAAGVHSDDDVLPFLTLPCLQEFRLGDPSHSYNKEMNTRILPFLSRASATLRTFTVDLLPLLPNELVPIEWFHITTHLTTLDLAYPQYMRQFLHALDRRRTPDFLPKLENLVYSKGSSDQVNNQLLDALQSRGPDDAPDSDTDTSCARLETFCQIWPENVSGLRARIPLEHVASLRALVSRRLHIHIGTRDMNTFH
ncbi:hypothetical protein B0H17DRAFT_1099257 [Mycena rosella]|uniref:F-box domain-containing protein n=1 Tax=Mycena rosella TaxID=1033263 RepID=A0AAD7CNV4_MYCRO|nr:hypothetical protein B0H17DRAFT_1099257 [Mycena rosella]